MSGALYLLRLNSQHKLMHSFMFPRLHKSNLLWNVSTQLQSFII